MRVLQLQTPNMTGPDVSDWQMFLQNQNVFSGNADGVFGPMTDTGTRAYQTKAGLTVDGMVGVNTLAQALIDGYQSTTGANIGGMDTVTDCTTFVGQMSAQGMKFAARYYSDDPSKALSLTEAQALSSGGLAIVAVFENLNNDANQFSTAIGQAQAATALQLAATIGQPRGTAIYFAVDYDATSADGQGPITDYFKAIKTAFAAAATQYEIGVYGSGMTCGVIHDAGLAKFTWIAGSMGYAEYATFRKQADIVQLAPERTLVAGLDIDDDIGQSAAFGAFTVAQAARAVST
jgi:peptidoglycan hydrolase-like protein with peptidoglycan-binding domain